MDYRGLVKRLQVPDGYSITTVGPTGSRSPRWAACDQPGIALDELRPQDSAMLILAGGETWGEDSMAGFRAAARQFLAAGVPVAAICGATFGLALEGLLDDRAHTSNAASISRSPDMPAATGSSPRPPWWTGT